MTPIIIPKDYNYIACFLTLSCHLKCSYCINIMDYKRTQIANSHVAMTPKQWIDGLNRIEAREDLPITIQGGEPTLHRDFYEIINGVNRPMDLLTNIQFNLESFMGNISTEKFKRDAPYASIRVSFHPEQMELLDTIRRVCTLRDSGYQVGVWMVKAPDQMAKYYEAEVAFKKKGIDFRGKELLGEYQGSMYGTYKYPNSVGQHSNNFKTCQCRTTELIIAPDGSVHRCHSDVYNLRDGIGHILDEDFTLDRSFRKCGVRGSCSPCDTKMKNNRHQVFGWTSVEIKNEGE